MALGAIVIDQVRPTTPGGDGRPRGAVGEALPVSARILRDGHGRLAARVRWRRAGSRTWSVAPLRPVGDDRFAGTVTPSDMGAHQFVVEAWTDRLGTWREQIRARLGAGDDVTVELEEGARILEGHLPQLRGAEASRVADAIATIRRATCTLDVRLNAALDDVLVPIVAGDPASFDRTATAPLPLWVDRERARHSAWYEFFPRSEGGLAASKPRVTYAAGLGFDVVYLPPIHPIGTTARKGKDNTLVARPDDVGSPWAIGGPEGGHTAIHPDLGTDDDLRDLVAHARSLGVEVALDYALQCSPDHPWVAEHPEWFHHRPDGTIRYAENPPKKYQDIYPIDFWPTDDADRVALWAACRDVLLHWIDRDIRIFRVDNPHTKPLAFWQWCIGEIHAQHPDVLFLAEAFTKPAMMAKLAEIGFSLSYTYFTWRHGKDELTDYVTELAHGPLADIMRPSFWPNTPDILAGVLRRGDRAAFALRYLLAATLVPHVGVYAGYELCENEPASEANEEYRSSEKYQLVVRDYDRPDSLAPFLAAVNAARAAHPALRQLRDITFHHVDHPNLLAYSKGRVDDGDAVLVVVNLDPGAVAEATVHLDLEALGLSGRGAFGVRDELDGATYTWQGPSNYVRLDPAAGQVGHLFAVQA